MTIQFNQLFDYQRAEQEFAKEQRARLLNILDDSSAQGIYKALSSEVVFDVALTQGNQTLNLSPLEWSNLSPERRKTMLQESQNAARQGIGFIYGRKNLSGIDKSNSTLENLNQWLNSEDVLAWVRQISGHDDIIAASAQATKYVPGHYLTRHSDVHPVEQRRVAYVISFTPEWHPDWGGLLQFYDNDGTPNISWAPGYNSISLFDVKHIHSVSYVTPFAGANRLSVTGWFRATPL